MLTGKLIDEAIAVAAAQGFEIRYEHLDGTGTGYCQHGSRRWVVVDVVQPLDEQLDQLVDAIASQPLPEAMQLSADLQSLVQPAPHPKAG